MCNWLHESFGIIWQRWRISSSLAHGGQWSFKLSKYLQILFADTQSQEEIYSLLKPLTEYSRCHLGRPIIPQAPLVIEYFLSSSLFFFLVFNLSIHTHGSYRTPQCSPFLQSPSLNMPFKAFYSDGNSGWHLHVLAVPAWVFSG